MNAEQIEFPRSFVKLAKRAYVRWNSNHRTAESARVMGVGDWWDNFKDNASCGFYNPVSVTVQDDCDPGYGAQAQPPRRDVGPHELRR